MIKAQLIRSKDKKEYHTYDGYDEKEPVLVTTTHASRKGVFKAATNTNDETVIIATPSGNDAIVLTDLIVSAKKVQSSTVTLQFTDGVNTEVLAVFDSGNNSVNLAISFQGHWEGWQAARLEVVTDTNLQVATTAVGYFYITEDSAQTYSVWDANR